MVIVYPVDDIEMHDLDSTTCRCDPKMEVYGDLLLIHNSFDRREDLEKKGIETNQLWEVKRI